MKERPILFSAPMVHALLAGTKTQTRRVIKRQPLLYHCIQPMFGTSPDGFAFGTPGLWREAGPDYPDGPEDDRRCPYGIVGDRLWVRETFTVPPGSEEGRECVYRADIPDDLLAEERAAKRIAGHAAGRWTPGIHMPRWASRITLEIISVRAQLLQQITREDAQAEGLPLPPGPAIINGNPGTLAVFDPLLAFRMLWQQINGERPGCSWESNPWVWAVSFRRIDG